MAALPLGRVGEDGKAALQAARTACSFDVRAMTYVLNGGKGITHRREEVAAKVRDDPVLKKKRNIIFMNRAQRVSYGWKALAHMHRRMGELDVMDNFVDRRAFKSEASLATGADLHDSMFTMTLNGQADEEQKAQWLPLAASKTIIGTYAQTELGHGSNLRSLETTATYDPKTESWDIHTPCLTAAKWWPGGLGKTSTHALVMARLVTLGEDHGIAPFLVQLRRQEDHEPMPGVTLGDIGPKYGFKTQDNGFLVLDHVRVPRRAMLMRFAKVAPDGTYSKPPHSKLKYGTMVGIRAGIVLGAGRGLGKACTIATRYSFVRKQFSSPSAAGEVSVIQYQTQQYKLLPLIATAYAFYFTGFYMAKLYMGLQANIDGSDFSTLPEVHAASAGLKALTTNLAGAGIEIARRACGGHGYSELSGLPEFLTDYVAAVTYEGENTLMAFQTARFLIKQVRAGASGARLTGGLSHLSPDARKGLSVPCPATSDAHLETADVLLAIFRHRAARLAFLVTDAVDTAVTVGTSEVDARNAIGVELVRASTAHCMVMVFDRFARAAAKDQSGAGVQRTLQRLCTLFGLYYIEQDLGEFMEDGYLSPQQAAWVRAGVRRLLGEVLPDAVGLVDAFGFSDFYLDSSLGLYDGDCYRDMFSRVVNNAPLNKKQVADGYKEHLQPLLQQAKWPQHNLPRSGAHSRL